MYTMGWLASNGLVYVAGDQVIMIDTPVTDSLTVLLINWFSEREIEFKAAIPTHWYDDCLGGFGAAQWTGIKSYGLNMTIELARQHNYIPPQIGFIDSLTLELNGQTIKCKYLGAGHTLDNIVV